MFDEEKHGHLPHYLSLGAGVQSSTLALMYACGELEPMPKAAIFADTQDEPQSVYAWLDWLEKQLPFPVHRVTAGRLSNYNLLIVNRKKDGAPYRKSNIPMFGQNDDGSVGILRRGCTVDFKIKPIHRFVKKHAGIKRGEKSVQVIQCIGISLDEIQRMKPSRHAFNIHRFPLIEKRIRRQGCIDWMESQGYPEPPRSACVFCPFHSNKEWRRLQNDEPEGFADAVAFDKALREANELDQLQTSVPYLHRSCKPLDEIDFRTDVERGQMTLWDDECEGMCGV